MTYTTILPRLVEKCLTQVCLLGGGRRVLSWAIFQRLSCGERGSITLSCRDNGYICMSVCVCLCVRVLKKLWSIRFYFFIFLYFFQDGIDNRIWIR